MATELIAGTSQFRFISLYAQRSKQLFSSMAGQMFQVTTKSRRALVICNIGDRCPRGNHAKPLIKGGEFAQKRLKGRLP
jgi:hypothetical protein